MSPLHQHFELKGWAQVTFWLIAGLFMIVSVSVFYLGWLNSTS